ncbi:MAG: hypothetical protein WCG73_03070, partial [Candidatus Moraniibacteriota bacterium]
IILSGKIIVLSTTYREKNDPGNAFGTVGVFVCDKCHGADSTESRCGNCAHRWGACLPKHGRWLFPVFRTTSAKIRNMDSRREDSKDSIVGS